jgi:dihydroneopterin aldolase
MHDTISIEDIEFETFTGITEEELSRPQTIKVSVMVDFDSLSLASSTDDVQFTINYFKIIEDIHTVIHERPRKLIETIAEEIASHFLRTYPYAIKKIMVKVKIKVPSPANGNTSWASVRIHRPLTNF